MREFIIVFNTLLPIVKRALSPVVDVLGNIPRSGPKPGLSDIEIITLSLTADTLGFDSENYLFDRLFKYKPLPKMIHRTVYNRRRRKLQYYIKLVQQLIAEAIVPSEQYHIVDSFPLPICRFARARRLRICKESFETAP